MRFLIIDNDNMKVNFMVSYLNSLCGERVYTNVPQTFSEALRAIEELTIDNHSYSHIIISKTLPKYDTNNKINHSGSELLSLIRRSNICTPIIDCTEYNEDRIKNDLEAIFNTKKVKRR